MIIGFLGKGGSGKSTVASQFALFLYEYGDTVLSIDADHNMDTVFNLQAPDSMLYIGQSMDSLKTHAGIATTQPFYDLYKLPSSPVFTLSPCDMFTQSFSIEIKPGFRVMATGPHHERILDGNKCSHSLSTPLKAYLPFLQLKEHEWVVVDERASSDSAATRTTDAYDIAYIVVEPTRHSVKSAQQISDILKITNVPFEYIVNKDNGDHNLYTVLEKIPIAYMPRIENFDCHTLSMIAAPELKKIQEFTIAHKASFPNRTLRCKAFYRTKP